MQKVIVGIIISLLAMSVKASIIYESATGAFDYTFCCGSAINSNQYIGAVFSIDEPTKVNAIGGHFMYFPEYLSGNIFGAIVKLNHNEFPSATAFTLDNIIAHTIFIPDTRKDYLAPILMNLGVGKYGVIFGSGLFGTTGTQALTLLQSKAVSSDSHIIATNPDRNWQVEDSAPWNRYRIIVSGEQAKVEVSEPSSYMLLFLVFVFLLGRNYLRRC